MLTASARQNGVDVPMKASSSQLRANVQWRAGDGGGTAAYFQGNLSRVRPRTL